MKPTLGTLEAVDLRLVWPDEARDFTPWLAEKENLRRLSDALGLELELERVEVAVGPYSADIVANDNTSNSRVVIENQLGKSDHDHLGKLLTYASGLEARILIWIARQFTEEHRQAFDYLNECTSGRLRLYGVEIELFRIGNSDPAPHFKVLSSPNDYVTTMNPPGSSLSENKVLYLGFWTAFRNYCVEHGETFNLRQPKAAHWHSISVGRTGFSINLLVSSMHARVGCEVYLRGAQAKKAFRQLEADREAIERMTGRLDWRELPEGQDCRVVDFLEGIDPANRSDWPKAFEWLKRRAEQFHAAFAVRIRSLELDEDEPDA